MQITLHILQLLGSKRRYHDINVSVTYANTMSQNITQQGKSEGFDSCDRPSNLAQIWSNSLIFQPVWPWNLMYNLEKIIGHLFYTTSSFVYHFKSIGEFKLKLQSGNAQFGSKSAIFCPVWPWNLMDEHGKQKGSSSILHQALCIISYPLVI